jgi:hypothetical protein
MDVLGRSAVSHVPEWVVAEMPPGYQTRLAEIQRLWADLGEMDQIGRLLWQIGDPLAQAVRAVFLALKYEVDSAAGAAPSLAVKLDDWRRLLIHVAESDGTIQRKSDEIAQLFDVLHRSAGDHDRVVLVTNGDRGRPPKERSEAITPDALGFVERMGVNVLRTTDLFKLWRLSHEDGNRARAYVDRLHTQDGGAFQIPS